MPQGRDRRADASRSKRRGRPPAVLPELVRLLLLDEQPGGGEQAVPSANVVEPEPAVIARLAERNGDEQPARRSEDSSEFAQGVDAGCRLGPTVRP
jgi:hypothetical protein